MKQKNLGLTLALVMLLALTSMPMTVSAQLGISGINVYAFSTKACMLTDMSYNETDHVFRVRVAEYERGTPDWTGGNVGLGFVEAVFSIDSIPTGLSGYAILEGEEIEIIDMLINWTISPYTFSFDNGTQKQARHLYAFFYTFTNQTITNSSSISPTYGSLNAPILHDSDFTLSNTYTTAGDYKNEVVLDYDLNPVPVTVDPIVVVTGIAGISIAIIVIVWYLKKRR